MAVVVSAVAPGLTSEMYDEISKRSMPGHRLPDGCLVHIAGPVEQGWRVITVWESQDAFQHFREENLLPAVKELAGEQGPPHVEPEINPVHLLITG